MVHFHIKEAISEEVLGSDPSERSEASSSECPFCKSALTVAYVRQYGGTQGFGQQLMCIIGLNPLGTGKLYLVRHAAGGLGCRKQGSHPIHGGRRTHLASSQRPGL